MGTAATPEPATGQAAHGDAFIGREAEVERVCAALEKGRPIALVGPAGIGKTTLAMEAARRNDREPRLGGAIDYLQSQPFLPLTRVLGRLPAPGDAAAVAAEVRRAVGAAVLVLDDLQWSDADTVEVLAALAATGPLIVTVRPGGDSASRATKQIDTIGEVIELRPLDDEQSLALARRWTGGDEAAARAAVAPSGGNPLAIAVLADARSRRHHEPARTLNAFVESCPHGARVTLGRLGLHDATVDAESEGVGELVERKLAEVTPAGDVVATADLFAELALKSLDPAEQIALHRRMAETTTDRGEAARHWLAAGDRSCAYAAATSAADKAPTAASRAQLLVLAASAASPDVQWTATRAAVSALLELGQLDSTRELVAEVEKLEPPTRSDAIDRELMRARLALDEQRHARVIELADAALEAAKEMTPQQHTSMVVMRAAARGETGDISGALMDAEHARDIAASNALSTLRADMLLAVLGALSGCADWKERLSDVYRRSIDGEHKEAREVARLYAMALFFDCDIETGSRVCDEVVAISRRSNNKSWECDARSIRAIHRSLVDLSPAEVVGELYELLDEPALTTERSAATTMLAIAEADHGNVEAADRLLSPARAAAEAAISRSREEIAWAGAEVAWNAGRFEECLVLATEVEHEASPIVFGKAPAAVLARWARWELGRDPAAVPLPLVVFRAQRGLIDEAHAIELLASSDHAHEAAERFLQAAERHDRYLRRNALRCRWGAGEALRRAGELEAATEILVPLAEVCERHGFAAIGHRVSASLRLAGCAPSRAPVARNGLTAGTAGTARNGLTARQREVLALVRQGLSTAAIATRLQLRPSTVDSHVRKAMRRLGASNRREAALLADDGS